MIFAFDFPKKTDKDGAYNNWPEVFNGLIGLPENVDPYFGAAPPSLIDLLSRFEIPFEVLDSDTAITSTEPFYYILETQGPPDGWLGTEDGYENTLLSGVSEKVIQAAQSDQCKIILISAQNSIIE